MAEMLVSIAVEQLISISLPVIQQEARRGFGVKKEVEKLSTTLNDILAVLRDSEEKQVRNEPVKVWLEDLKYVAYDIDDVCDEWRTRNSISHIEGVHSALISKKKVCSYFFPCFGFNRVILRRDIGRRIKDIWERLDVIDKKKNQFNFTSRSIEEPVRYETSSVITSLEICGREEDSDIITSKLLGESSEKMGLTVISIVGMGGIGKTTLAQKAYNDRRVTTHFSYKIWVCVSEPFDKISIAKEVIKGVRGNVPNDSSWNILHNSLSDSVKDKQFLLVLDDVWTNNYTMWEPLLHSLRLGAPGSRVLVTTRNEGVAQMMGTTYMHRLETLSEEECWSLISSIALWGWEMEENEKMKEIGKEIAKKCKGLPLSAKTLGGLLRSKRTKGEWQNVLKSEIWELKEVEEVVLPALLLSYYDLPSHLKRCFQYCAVFPKDYPLRKNSLIKLWMAQGFIRSGGGRELEVKGEEYFSDLVIRSFFQDFEIDRDGNIENCKMHDMVHDFAQFLTKNEYFIMDSNNNAGDWNCKSKARHSTVVVDELDLDSTLSSICNLKNLRTLVFFGWSESLPAPPFELLCQLTCLRALDLSWTRIEALPNAVEKLIHLRYLDLSCTKVRKLPEIVSNLYNLQTLNLTACQRLGNLPEGIGKLISLRHLEILGTDLSYLPRGIGRLSSLQTLSNFIVGGGVGGCKIGDLKDLNFIRGKLRIVGLGNEANVKDTKEAGLMNKQHLRSLELIFHSDSSTSVGRGTEEEERMEGVIDGIQPHPDLEKLAIQNYPGTKLPKNWLMSDDGLVVSSNLVSLKLRGCINCMQLPSSLGKLPSLQELGLGEMNAVTNVDHEFFGFRDADDRLLFPKLTRLSFTDLTNWEEWDMITRFKDDDISIMPRLSSLILIDCPKLKALPYHFLQNRTLQKLWIFRCSVLEELCQKEVGKDWSKISHIPDIEINRVKIQSTS